MASLLINTVWPESRRRSVFTERAGLVIVRTRSLGACPTLTLSTAANDLQPSALFSAPKNPGHPLHSAHSAEQWVPIPSNTPPGFRSLRPCICQRLLRLVTNGNVGQTPRRRRSFLAKLSQRHVGYSEAGFLASAAIRFARSSVGLICWTKESSLIWVNADIPERS